MPNPKRNSRNGQLKFIEQNWTMLVSVWQEKREALGSGVLAIVVDEQDHEKLLAPIVFCTEAKLAKLVEQFEGSQEQRIMNRGAEAGHLAIAFIHRDNKFIHVDSYALRLSAENHLHLEKADA